MSLRLVVRALARADVRRNGDWMRRNFGASRSTRWVAGVVAAFDDLALDPDRYPEADEAADLGLPLRYKAYGRRPHVFRVLFTVEGETVSVLRVLHAAHDRLTEDDL